MNCVNCGHSEDVHESNDTEDSRNGLPRKCKVVHPSAHGSTPCGCLDYIAPKKDQPCGDCGCAESQHETKEYRGVKSRACTCKRCRGFRPVPPETVNHPQHYGGDTTYEHIKVVHAWGLNYELGNATKYICRAGKKDQSKAVEDLEKAVWYLQAEIKRRKAGDLT